MLRSYPPVPPVMSPSIFQNSFGVHISSFAVCVFGLVLAAMPIGAASLAKTSFTIHLPFLSFALLCFIYVVLLPFVISSAWVMPVLFVPLAFVASGCAVLGLVLGMLKPFPFGMFPCFLSR